MRHGGILLAILAVGSVIILAEPLVASAGPYDPIWIGPAAINRGAIMKALDEPAELKVRQAPLTEVLDSLGTKYTVNVHINRQALEDAGVSPDTPITEDLKNTTLGEVLAIVLHPLELTWVIRYGMLLVTTINDSETIIDGAIYPVDDLLYPPAELRRPGLPNGPDYDSLIELLSDILAPATWHYVGGQPWIPHYRGSIIILENQDVHADVADMLNQLRAARQAQFPEPGKPPIPALRGSVERTRADAVYAALQKPVDLDLRGVNLRQLAKLISQQVGVAVEVDAGADLAKGGINPDEIHFDIRLGRLKLREALQILLDKHELAWVVRGGALTITAPYVAEQTRTTRVYPIHDLRKYLPRSPAWRFFQEYEHFGGLITGSLSPRSWAELGGPGAWRVFANAGALVIHQTDQVHGEIEQFLAGLRQFRGEHPVDPIEEANPPPAEDELVTFAYHAPGSIGWDTETAPAANAGGKSPAYAGSTSQSTAPQTDTHSVPPSLATREQIAAQLAAALPKLVEPASWQQGGGLGTVEAVGDVLYVRQRMAIHNQVAKLLQPVVNSTAGPPPRKAPVVQGGDMF